MLCWRYKRLLIMHMRILDGRCNVRTGIGKDIYFEESHCEIYPTCVYICLL